MYQEFYSFSAEPFRLSPDQSFSYAHKGYNKARAYMAYAFHRAEGFVMITGRPGTGKTTLIGTLVAELADTSVNIANLVCTQLQANDLLKMVAYDFGIPLSVVDKGELLQRLTQQFKTWHRDGRRALLIVDEAQDLSISAMEELRLLTNIQVDSRPLLQIFLLGQPELRELILSPALEQVHQRIIAASHLQPLKIYETEAYIRHRLSVVNWRGNPAFSKAVYPLVYKFSEGVPRRINLICSRLLLHCAVEERYQVTVADVREVVRELQDENLASGSNFSETDFQVVDVFDDHIVGDNRLIAETAKFRSPGGCDQVVKTTGDTRHGTRPDKKTQAGGEIYLADKAGSHGGESAVQHKIIAGVRQSAPNCAEVGLANVTVGDHRRASEAPGVVHRGQALKIVDSQSRPQKNPTPQTVSGGVRPHGTSHRAKSTGQRSAKAIPSPEEVKIHLDQPQNSNQKEEFDAAHRERYKTIPRTIIITLLVAFLLVSWLALGFEIDNFLI